MTSLLLAPAAVVPPLARAFGIPLRLPHANGVALTFDDGPHPEGTPAVLETLRAAGATAGLEPGDVVLLHDSDSYSSSGSWRRTVAALPSILDAVATLGVPCVAVTQST